MLKQFCLHKLCKRSRAGVRWGFLRMEFDSHGIPPENSLILGMPTRLQPVMAPQAAHLLMISVVDQEQRGDSGPSSILAQTIYLFKGHNQNFEFYTKIDWEPVEFL